MLHHQLYRTTPNCENVLKMLDRSMFNHTRFASSTRRDFASLAPAQALVEVAGKVRRKEIKRYEGNIVRFLITMNSKALSLLHINYFSNFTP